MQKLTLKSKYRSYDIFCGQNIIKDIASLFDLKADKICIITDSNVAPLYLKQVKEAIGSEVFNYTFKAGESTKCLNTCIDIYNYLAKIGFTRTDILIALGGGVTGDMAGFIASTYLRGIKYYSIPTTLLSQVDSSVGGKCGVDIAYGKNLVGSFYQPFGVIIDTDVLKTLSKSIFSDGMAEVIKYGFIYDRNIYDMCLENVNKYLFDIIVRCIDIKREIVEIDEHDDGLRMILNFGHTIGHAVESLGCYKRYSHGQAIAIGMAYAAKLSENAQIGFKGIYGNVTEALKLFNLPIKSDYTAEEIMPVLLNDKKIRSGRLNFILLKDIGSSIIYKIDSSKAYDFIKEAFI